MIKPITDNSNYLPLIFNYEKIVTFLIDNFQYCGSISFSKSKRNKRQEIYFEMKNDTNLKSFSDIEDKTFLIVGKYVHTI